jgi:hypothetical protein
MKRGITILLSLSVLVTGAYFTASKWAIRHETISFYDPDRNNRLVAVDVTVRRDKEIQANAGMIRLPVAILNTETLSRTPSIRSWPTSSLGAVTS